LSELQFFDGGKRLEFNAADKTWSCSLDSYECKSADKKSDSKSSAIQTDSELASLGSEPAEYDGVSLPSSYSEDDPLFQDSPQQPNEEDTVQQPTRPRGQGRAPGERRRGGDQGRPRQSPDGKWSVLVTNHNVVLRSAADGKEYQLTDDGKEGNSYSRLEWAPDSMGLVAWRIEPGDHKEVYLVQSTPPGGGRAVLRARPYDLPGDKLDLYELSVFDIAGRKQIKPEVDRYEHGYESPVLHWMHDRRHFAYVKADRGHQRYRVIEVDSQTGQLR